MKSIIITLVCFMAGCASPSGQSDSCSPPARATYSVTATPLEYGCGGTRVSTATFEDGLVTSGERDEVELVDSCTTRALNGRDTFGCAAEGVEESGSCTPPAGEWAPLFLAVSDDCPERHLAPVFVDGHQTNVQNDSSYDTELLKNGCVARTEARNMSLVVTFNADWSYGVGSFRQDRCLYRVTLETQAPTIGQPALAGSR